MRTVRRTVAAPADLGVGLIGVPTGAELDLDLRMESVVEGVLVSGRVAGPLVGECGRCLDPLTSTVEARVQELYAYPESSSAASDEDDVSRLDGDFLDLEPVLRDAVVLALPLAPLCRDDCPGRCVTCGARLADGECDCEVVLDSRWAALREVDLDQMVHDREREQE
jgi:uncharacterized protein